MFIWAFVTDYFHTLDISKLQQIAGIFQAFAMVLAIIVGGFWSYKLFVQKRQKYPRATIAHQIKHYLIAEHKILLHVCVSVSNTGDVILRLISCRTRVQQILPLEGDLIDLINTGQDPVKKGRTEVLWPELKSIESNCNMEIEPGESDEIHYDFILEDEVRLIEIYSYFKNIKKRWRSRNIGWNLTTIYDLKNSTENYSN